MDQKRTVDGPKMVPLDRPKMVHAYKEQIDSSLKDSKAAAGFSSPGSSERDQEDAAANPFSDYEDEPKDLCPVVVTSKFDTEQAQAIRKILEAAGIKDRRDDAEKMVAYTKQQNLEPRVMFEFLDWKIKKCQGSKRIETSGFMLRSLQEDLPHYAESFHGRLLKLCLEEDRKAAEVKKIALTPVSLARAQEVLYARFQSVPSIVIERLERKGVFEISPEELLQIGLKVKPCETCKFSGLTGSLLLKTFRFCDCEYGVERCEILGQEYTAKRIADVPSGFKERVVMALEELANPYSAIAIQEGKFQFTENEWDVVISYDPSVARLYPVKDIEAAIAYMGDTRMIKLSNPRCFVCLDTGKYRVHSGEVCCDCPVGFRAREAELELKRAEPKPQAKQAPNSKRMPVTGADVAKILARMERRA